MNYLGIDIGGTEIKIGRVNEEGQLLETQRYPSKISNENPYLVDALKDALVKVMMGFSKQGIEINGIGISATGQIDKHTGIVIGTGGNIRGWDQTNLKLVVGEYFDGLISVDNDVNCALLGEHWIGSAKDFKNVFMYTIGTGIGGAIIINNELYLGMRGLAGEFGHISIDHNGRECTCKKLGCFEQYGSMTALLKDTRDWVSGAVDIKDGRHLIKLLREGRYQLEKPIEAYVGYHAAALSNILHLLNPEAIIIGGGLSEEHALIIEPIVQKVKEITMVNFTLATQIVPASLGNNAGMIGAVRNLLNEERMI